MNGIDDSEFDHPVYSPVCSYCVHLTGRHTCAAFPGGVPWTIWDGMNPHTAPYEGDNGITFAPATGMSEGHWVTLSGHRHVYILDDDEKARNLDPEQSNLLGYQAVDEPGPTPQPLKEPEKPKPKKPREKKPKPVPHSGEYGKYDDEHAARFRARCERFHDRTRTAAVEHLEIYNDDGTILEANVGGPYSVGAKDPSHWRGHVSIHHHPIGGGAFSFQDIIVDVAQGTTGSVVSNADYIHYMFPKGGNWPSRFDLRVEYDKASIYVEKSHSLILDPMARDPKVGYKEYGAKAEELTRNRSHEIWERVAKKTGITYWREKR